MDLTWPEREGAADFKRLLNDPSSLVLVARDGAVAFGFLVEHFLSWARDLGCVEARVSSYVANAGLRSSISGLALKPTAS